MRAIRFRLPAGEKEELLDALMPLLPAGVRELPRGDEVELVSVAAAPPSRAALEAAAGLELAGWEEHDVPADWRARRVLLGGGILVGGRILVRSPDDPPADAPGLIDLELERGGGGFGSGSHPTTRMCLELLLDAGEPSGGAADLGCGLGTLAIAAARLGWSPVAGVDRMAGAVAVARANGERNGVAVDWAVTDLEADPVPLAALLLVNAPPPVQERVAGAAAGAAVATAIVSGMLLPELREALPAYAAAGLHPVRVLEDDGWVAARLEQGPGDA
ncbi:MAG TPA: 50S ribosomal protein L11 methyltransferase [Solirubrobacteraceae bacterium]|nr:50S ribosomal protein L11 methyltransferase [Solirubrobacteraceae bacterium]